VASSEPERAAQLLAEAGFSRIERADGRLRVFDVGDRAPEIARILVQAGLDMSHLAQVSEDLEEHFLRLTGGAQ